MKTFNEKNFSNHNRGAERDWHGNGARRSGVAESFIITGGIDRGGNSDS